MEGMKITLNYFGETNNRFGLKKRKVLFEEDKMQALSAIRKRNNIKFQRLKKDKLSIDYMINIDLMKNTSNNSNNNFELIKIKDFEKTKNYNFFNYFKNVKYFNRINSYKRNLSSSQISTKNNNYKNESIIEENAEINKKKKEIKNKNKIFIKFDNINNNYNKKRREFNISKIDINKIITNYVLEYKNDVLQFNQKNKKINNKMIIQNRIRLNSISKSTINKKKENLNMLMKNNNNNKNDKRNNSINKSFNYVSLRDSKNEINSKLKFQNKLYNLKYNLENKNHIKDAIIISKKNFFYNNINYKHKTRPKLFSKKISSSIDASTNTDFYKYKNI